MAQAPNYAGPAGALGGLDALQQMLAERKMEALQAQALQRQQAQQEFENSLKTQQVGAQSLTALGQYAKDTAPTPPQAPSILTGVKSKTGDRVTQARDRAGNVLYEVPEEAAPKVPKEPVAIADMSGKPLGNAVDDPEVQGGKLIYPKGGGPPTHYGPSEYQAYKEPAPVSPTEEAIREATLAALLEKNKPADPGEVEYFTKQVLNNPSLRATMVANPQLQKGVQMRLSQLGIDLNDIDTQSRTMSNVAKVVSPQINEVADLANQVEQLGLMGPLAGRWRDFMTKKIGAGEISGGNAQAAALLGELQSKAQLLASAAAKAHGGARAGGSPAMLAKLESLTTPEGKDLPTYLGSLRGVKSWMDDYASLTANRYPGGFGDPTGGAAGAGGGQATTVASGTPYTTNDVRQSKDGTKYLGKIGGQVVEVVRAGNGWAVK